MQGIALLMLADVMSKLADGESCLESLFFQDFWTGTVLECQATSGSVFMNMCFKVCVYVQTCHFTFIRS